MKTSLCKHPANSADRSAPQAPEDTGAQRLNTLPLPQKGGAFAMPSAEWWERYGFWHKTSFSICRIRAMIRISEHSSYRN